MASHQPTVDRIAPVPTDRQGSQLAPTSQHARDAVALWDYERWHCVYVPLVNGFGRLVVYSGDQPVLEMPKVSEEDAEDRAIGLRMLAQLATNRLSQAREAR